MYNMMLKQIQQSTGQRLRHLGLGSLLSLLTGGTLLLLIGLNTSTSSPSSTNPQAASFIHGSWLPVQAWIALLGVCLGLLKHGILESYAHFFDWWCTRKAKSSSGLDYAKYLNTQPRAPTSIGLEGFPLLISLRYLLLLATIGASIGYKFALVDIPSTSTRILGPNDLIMDTPTSYMYTDSSAANPGAHSGESIPILYREDQGDISAPKEVFLVSVTSINSTHWDGENSPDRLLLNTREIAILANLTNVRFGSTVPSSLHDETSEDWGEIVKDPIKDEFFVRFRMPDSGRAEIQIASIFSGGAIEQEAMDDFDGDEPGEGSPIMWHLIYDIRYAVRSITRELQPDGEFHILSDLSAGQTKWLSVDDEPPELNANAPSFRNRYGSWVEAIMLNPDSSIDRDIRDFVYIALTYVGRFSSEQHSIGIIEPGDYPFGRESDISIQEYEWTMSEIPEEAWEGYHWIWKRDKGGKTACMQLAARTFVAVGIAAMVIFCLRILIGPPQLTSWMGQHVYLVRTGHTAMGDSACEKLGNGRQIADSSVGKLRL